MTGGKKGQLARARRGMKGNLSAVAETIAVPHLHRPLRLPSFPELARTAVLALEGNRTEVVGASTIQRGMLIRDPCFPLWMQKWVPPGDFASVAARYVNFDMPFMQINVLGASGTFPDKIEYTYSSGYPADYTVDDYKFIPIGVHTNKHYTCVCDIGGNVAIESVLTAAVACELEYTLEWYDGADFTFSEHVVTHTAASATAALTFNVIGTINIKQWVRIKEVAVRVASATSALLSQVYIGWTTSSIANGTGAGKTPITAPSPDLLTSVLYPVSPPIAFQESVRPYTASRANATSVLLTNVTAVMAKEGVIRAGRLQAESTAFWAPSTWESRMNALLPVDRAQMAMETGLYTYTQPSSGSSVFRDRTTMVYHNGFGSSAWPLLWLEDVKYANVFQLVDIDSSTTTKLAVTWDVHLEFANSSALFQTGFSMMRLEDFHVTQMALAKQGCFFENPTHLSMIGGMIRRAVSTLAPIVAPHLVAAGQAVGSYVVNRAYRTLSTKMPQASLTPPAPRPVPRAPGNTRARPKRTQSQRRKRR